MIGDDIEIAVVDIRGDKVRLGVSAPKTISVHRREVYDQIKAENQAASGMQPGDLPGGAAPATKQLALAVLVGGGGTTLANLLDRIADRSLHASVNLVIGSRPGLLGVERAARAGVANVVIERGAFTDIESYSTELFARIEKAGVDLVVLGGWLSLLAIPEHWAGRVMNIHPSLLPSFGGKGMFGARVHEAVIASGCKVSGCTVHFVDNTYDTGPIILQRPCEVRPGDIAKTLAARVFDQECAAYPEAIRLYQRGQLRVDGRVVHIDAVKRTRP